MRTRDKLLVKTGVHRFHLGFRQWGIDTAPIYRQLGIAPSLMEDQSASLGMAQYLALLNLASDRSGNRFLGVEMALASEHRDMGILVYMLRNARNFEHAINILRRYVVLVSPGSSIALLEEESQYVLTYELEGFTANQCCQDVEATITQFVRMIRDLLHDVSWQPSRIYFKHKCHEPEDPRRFPLGSEVIFDHSYNGVCFAKDILQYPNDSFDPKLLAVLESHAVQSARDLVESDTTNDRVRLLISSGLSNLEMTSDDVAKGLGLSRRSLHRRLQEEGTSYKVVRENVILRLAKEGLIQSSVPIAELAQSLGYSDSSAFNRAFKRLTGQAPLQYRKSHGSPRVQ